MRITVVGIGYGGSCFPKDVRELIHTGQQQNYPMTITQAVQQVNVTQQDRFTQKIMYHTRSFVSE